MTRRNLATEHEIQAAIIGYLRLRKWLVIRVNSGRLPDSRGHLVRFVDCGEPGLAVCDLLAFGSGGRVLAIECKRPGEPATDRQRAFLERMASLGATALVANSVATVIEAAEAEQRRDDGA